MSAELIETMHHPLQAVLHLRQAFLERLTSLKMSRESIAKGLTGSLPSTFRNRMSAAASLGVRLPKEIIEFLRQLADGHSQMSTSMQISLLKAVVRCLIFTKQYKENLAMASNVLIFPL